MEAPTAAFPWPQAPGEIDPVIEQDASAIVEAALGQPSIVDDSVDAGDLSEAHRAMLDFERRWWRQPGAKEQAIRETFSMTPTRYYQTLNAVLDLPAAIQYDAPLVHRLQRLRTSSLRGRRLA